MTIGLVAVPETAPATLYRLLEVFASVGTTWEELTGKPAGTVHLRPAIVADEAGLIRCGLGAPVLPDGTFDAAPAYDVVIAPDLLVEPGMDPRGQWPAATAWIRSQYAGGAIVGSVCTGGLLLAEAGVLDDLEATSHWGVVPLFHALYPQVRLKPEKVLALSGPEQRIVTAGGAASWIELAPYT